MMRVQRVCCAPRVLFLSCCLYSVVSGYPQWVWNQDVIDNTRIGNNNNNNQNRPSFSGQSTRFPDSSQFPFDPSKSNIRVVSGNQRTFPSAISAISNAVGGGGGSSVGSGLGGGLGQLGQFGQGLGGQLGGVFGGVLQTIPQLATQALTGLFRPQTVTLPAKDPGDLGVGSNSGSSNSGNFDSGVSTTGACKCVSATSCFLPSKATGSCEGGRVQCCGTTRTRTVFPGDSSSGQSTRSTRTVTQAQIRRGLLQQILKGSGSIVDNALDLILTPYLSTEDQQKIATRVIE